MWLCFSPGYKMCLPLSGLSNDDLGLFCVDLGWGSGGRGVFAHARFSMSPHPNRGVVPGAEGMRARPTSPFSHYFSKGK